MATIKELLDDFNWSNSTAKEEISEGWNEFNLGYYNNAMEKSYIAARLSGHMNEIWGVVMNKLDSNQSEKMGNIISKLDDRISELQNRIYSIPHWRNM